MKILVILTIASDNTTQLELMYAEVRSSFDFDKFKHFFYLNNSSISLIHPI